MYVGYLAPHTTAMRIQRPSQRYPDIEISTLFWGAVIFLTVFVVCLLTWKAIERLRTRKK